MSTTSLKRNAYKGYEKNSTWQTNGYHFLKVMAREDYKSTWKEYEIKNEDSKVKEYPKLASR